MTRTFWVEEVVVLMVSELGEVVYKGGRITSLQIWKSDRGSNKGAQYSNVLRWGYSWEVFELIN